MEYFARRGPSTNDGFLDALYQDTLHRAIDSAARQNFDHALATGTLTRTQVAAGVLGSEEYFAGLTQSIYNEFLHRPVDSTGLANALQALKHGAANEAIISGVVGSDEYLAKRT